MDGVFERLGLKNLAVLNARGKTLRQQACQIDLLIRSRRAISVCGMKFRRHIGIEVIDELSVEVAKRKLPKARSVRTALPTIEPSDDFDFIINADDWIMTRPPR